MKLYPEAFQLYVNESGRLRTPASVRSFRSVIGPLQAQNPTLPVGRFTEDILTRFCLHGSPAPNTVKHRRTIIRSVFEWLAWKGVIKSDPSVGLKYSVSPGRHKVRDPHWLDESQIVRILRSCPDDFKGRRDRVGLMFGFMMGLRLSTLADLRWAQLDSGLSVLEVTVKGQKRTRKGVPAQLRSELVSWRQEAPEDAVAILPRLNEIGIEARYIDPDWSRPLGRTGVTNMVKRASSRAGVQISPHDLRRSMAGVMESKGADVMTIQRALDHTNVGTTSIYLDQNPNRTQEATQGLTLEL